MKSLFRHQATTRLYADDLHKKVVGGVSIATEFWENDGSYSITGAGNITSAATIGVLVLSLSLIPVGFADAEAFGQPSIAPYNPPIEITNAGNIGTGFQYGTPGISGSLGVSGIASQGQCGTDSLSAVLVPLGAVSGNIFGAEAVNSGISCFGIVTGENAGTGELKPNIAGEGIGSSLFFGIGSISFEEDKELSISGIASENIFGISRVYTRVITRCVCYHSNINREVEYTSSICKEIVKTESVSGIVNKVSIICSTKNRTSNIATIINGSGI